MVQLVMVKSKTKSSSTALDDDDDDDDDDNGDVVVFMHTSFGSDVNRKVVEFKIQTN
jgi:hypothetical protein